MSNFFLFENDVSSTSKRRQSFRIWTRERQLHIATINVRNFLTLLPSIRKSVFVNSTWNCEKVILIANRNFWYKIIFQAVIVCLLFFFSLNCNAWAIRVQQGRCCSSAPLYNLNVTERVPPSKEMVTLGVLRNFLH